ncbi:Glycoside hydrolase 2 (Mannanase, beta-galactosidase) [Neophaeococcomyces mojaviensis]|uniref:Glycoside hydrolase 2 (Mannanase, beta-galactosidase) n=1 Tax=Neophaeococcomyces mojaviensis TaxID=3383035 RepID=A0ACC2ZWY0_9EURO|nr:Glycoside hydrolase 2 (Mannanase, beta-galactosidase) [Knufia sp. JES_112]
METQSNRPHRASKEKKQPRKGEKNVKAFAVANPGRLAKQAVRSSDIRERRLHVPQVDRIPEEAPPIVTAVVGPPGVGKTTLIKSLIKRYSKQTLSHPVGPLTVVTSKRRRLTFIECPSESLAAMLDVAKIADIVLLMIDGNYGFEMETMEFLNALGTHGMPGNVFGILTHLDLFKKQSTLAATKKRLKHRFWSELYQGAKLFYLSGVINGRYPDREIHNLSRFLSVMKNPRPLIWRNSHPYCLADRFLDVTPPTEIEENEKCDRQIALYGYLRGTNFPATNARVHIPGLGDLTVKEIEALPDPCPTPFLDQAMAKASGKSSRRRLGEKQKVLFAPMSDVGGVLVDKDAVYIDVKTNTFDADAEDLEERGLGEQLMVNLQAERRLLGRTEGGVRLFADSNTYTQEADDAGRKTKRSARGAQEHEDDTGDEDDEGFVEGDVSDEDENEDDDINDFPDHDGLPGFAAEDEVADGDEDVEFADSDSDMGSVSGEDFHRDIDDEAESEDDEDDEDDGGLRWKENMARDAEKLHSRRNTYRASDLSKLMYDLTLSPRDVISRWTGRVEDNAAEENDEDDFFRKTNVERADDDEDRLMPRYDFDQLATKWQDEDNIKAMRSRFTRDVEATGANAVRSGASDDEFDDDEEAGDEDSEGDGDFVDLEANPENPEAAQTELTLEEERRKNAKRKEELRLRFEEEDYEGFANPKNTSKDNDDEEFGEDDWYDAQKAMLQKQIDINRAEFDALDPYSRARAEGFKAGTYARVVLDNVPYEFSKSFNPRVPVIIGGLAPTEERMGFVQIRIKRHRWHKKILKTNDPLIFSLGWRRFQTTPLYSISDSRTRNRMLKYTPEHMHCFGTFYGPLVAPNTGFCCVQSFNNSNPGFRIAATGVVLNVDETTEIVKKLKLTGVPYKIFRNTAFIKDMFNSAMEIAKFEGASIKTVSGIRGQIKRALSKPEGHFRATFEDKILMSDIVFLRAWFPVKPHRFYNPVTNLLDISPANGADGTGEKSTGWKPMRLTGQVRASIGQSAPQQKDSRYTKFERPTRHFNPLRVPRQLATNLPFKSQITQTKARKAPTYMQKRAVVLGGEERKARDLMQKLMTLRNEKVEKRARKQEERREVYRKKVAENIENKEAREKRERDDFWRKEGRKRAKQEEGGGGGKRRKR